VVTAVRGADAWRFEGPFAGDDATVLGLVDDATVLGLDAPLGWPDEFVAAVGAHHRFEPWPRGVEREDLRLRATDRFVIALDLGVRPLSVSSDLIGVVAMRAAALLGALGARRGGPVARDGSDGVFEVYPAAALRARGLLARRGERYKGGPSLDPATRAVRARVVGALAARGVAIGPGLGESATASDHVLDAIISALVAIAALDGATHPVPADLAGRAAREGWIHVPARPL
jgi:predicted nuclease with RNAse H fold